MKFKNFIKRKKKLLIILAIIIIAITAITIIVRNKISDKNSDIIYVESVSDIAGYGSMGAQERYSAVVESQKTVPVKADSNMSIKECFVKVGDEVAVGTQLFSYDTDAINIAIEEAQLEVDKLKAEIASLSQQIQDLQKEKASAASEEQLSYTVEIQSLTNEQTSDQYDLNSKQADLEKLKASLNNTVVVSTVAGIVKSIGTDGSDNSSYNDFYSNDDSEDQDTSDDGTTSGDNASTTTYMTILPLGNYQIKGTLTEFDKDSLSEGMDILIRSRVDLNEVVKGKITSVDFDNPTASSSNSYEDDNTSAGETSTKYNFYASFDNNSNLILGQHVYVELDYGQTEQKDGLWISDMYISTDKNDNSFVWKEKNGKLTKQIIKLGDYDDNNMEYEILDGLSEKDYIAFPSDICKDGTKTTHNYDKATITDEDDSNIDYENSDDADIDNGDLPDEDIIDDGNITDDEGDVDAEGISNEEGALNEEAIADEANAADTDHVKEGINSSVGDSAAIEKIHENKEAAE